MYAVKCFAKRRMLCGQHVLVKPLVSGQWTESGAFTALITTTQNGTEDVTSSETTWYVTVESL